MDFDLIAQLLPFTIQAGWITIQLAFVSLAIGLCVAFVVAALRSSKHIFIWPLAAFYVSIMRGTPLLIQIFLIYYGAFAFGFDTTPFFAATLTMGFNIGAYMSEGIRGAIQSVDKGQYEAARALGFGKIRTLFYFIIPQAATVMIRTIEINTIILTKSTALASTIGVIELTYTAQRFVTSNSGNSFEIFGLAAIAYIIILSAILTLFQLLISAFNKTKISGAS
ncbi:amino acid ABC transporter permease [Bartonella sp. HY761]|uniref:amino acid ABC transporter permease n=1 Tax=Bartonella sp. HY761 TaxID=2979330 RepID=UPI002206B2E1|nr:amino acid ABC transporter permease [Bartonella sp. HY761]UXN05484.1 amino acid ABC transporter permease [Bartonella sp. HY761]